MKRTTVILLAAGAVLASCSDSLSKADAIESAKKAEISFANSLPGKITRTTLNSFPDASVMQVYGYQSTGSLTDTVFFKQDVTYNESQDSWTYSPLKYWNKNSSYEFYAIYPSNPGYGFDLNNNFTVYDFLVKDAIADQTDIMIAEKNNATPFNVVTMNFNHILSQVNFTARHAMTQAADGVSGVKVNSLSLTGIMNYGTFTQDGFDATTGNVKGTWASLNGEYTFPGIGTGVELNGNVKTNLVTDLLLVPQPLNALLTVNYTISYSDGTKSTFEKTIPMETIESNGSPITAWKHNTIYNYNMLLDPTKVSKEGDFSDCQIDWNGSFDKHDDTSGTEGDCVATDKSFLIGPDADGEYYVWIDVNGDSIEDALDTKYPVVWADLDGDGREEGGIDANGDGYIDNVDGETVNHSDPESKQVTDGDATNNPDGRDGILVYDKGGDKWLQLERTVIYRYSIENPTQYKPDWNGSRKEYDDRDGTDGDAVPTSNSRLTVGDDGNFYIEIAYDGNFDDGYDSIVAVVWKDIDSDKREEGYLAGNQDADMVNNEDAMPKTPNLVTDGETGNPTGEDAILLATHSPFAKCDIQLEREATYEYGPKLTNSNEIVFSATVESWSDTIDVNYRINQ